MYKFIDLFAGIGGFRLAFEANDCQCVFSSEIDKFAQQTYTANFGETPTGDITQVSVDDIPDFDILVGGFPCQPFSLAGIGTKKFLDRPTGFEDKTSGTLFFDICRILQAKRPKAFLLENVKNLASHDKGNTFKVILESLSELGYKVFYKVIDGQLYVPQHRERMIIVGFRKDIIGDEFFDFALNPPERRFLNIGALLEPTVDAKYTLSDKMWGWIQSHTAKHQALGHGFSFGLVPLNGVTNTLTARYYKDGKEILIPQAGSNPRRLTPRECARLQGFPDDFKIVCSNTQAYKQFGNAVVVPLMKDVARLVVQKLDKLQAT